MRMSDWRQLTQTPMQRKELGSIKLQTSSSSSSSRKFHHTPQSADGQHVCVWGRGRLAYLANLLSSRECAIKLSVIVREERRRMTADTLHAACLPSRVHPVHRACLSAHGTLYNSCCYIGFHDLLDHGKTRQHCCASGVSFNKWVLSSQSRVSAAER